MKIKLGEIIGGFDEKGGSIGVQKLKNLLDTKFPVKVSYRLNRLSGKIESELKTYTETKNAAVLEIAKDLPDPTKITPQDTKEWEEFTKRHNELLDMEVEIDFEPIKIEELGDVQVAPNDMISWIFA